MKSATRLKLFYEFTPHPLSTIGLMYAYLYVNYTLMWVIGLTRIQLQ
jgi:hypothetical protein